MSETSANTPDIRLEVRRGDNDDYPHNQGQNMNISFWEVKEGGILDGMRLGQITYLEKTDEGKLMPTGESAAIAARVNNETNKSVSQLYYPVKGEDGKFESIISAGTMKYKKIISKGGAEYDAVELVLMPENSGANSELNVEYRDLSDETKESIRAAQREAGLYYATAWPGYKSERTPENGIDLLKPMSTVEDGINKTRSNVSPKDYDNYVDYMVALMDSVNGNDDRSKAYAMNTLSYAVGARIGFLSRESDVSTASDAVKAEVEQFLDKVDAEFISKEEVLELFNKVSEEKKANPPSNSEKPASPKKEEPKQEEESSWDDSDIPF